MMENYTPHKKAEVRAWLDANPRTHIHFTPTSGSWPNLVEVWFRIIEVCRSGCRESVVGAWVSPPGVV